MAIFICKIGDYYLHRGDPCVSESLVMQTAIITGAIAAFFFAGYTLGRNSSVMSSKDDTVSQSTPFVNILENPLTSATLARSQNSSQQSLDEYDDMGGSNAVSISSSIVNETTRQHEPLRRSTSEQDNSGQASSANFLNPAASTATYASKHSSTRSSRSATPHNTIANPLQTYAAQTIGTIVNGGMNRLSLADQGIPNRIITQYHEGAETESFGTVSSCSSASTPQVIEDGEYVMVQFRNGSQTSSTLTSARREES